MEGQVHETADPWLYNFRQKISSSCGPLEFAKNAISYDPYEADRVSERTEDGPGLGDKGVSLYNGPKCSGFEILDVSSVFSLGKEAFITCSDVRINLCKIYVYLTEAIARLNGFEDPDSTGVRDEYLGVLESLSTRFGFYIRICMRLAEDLHHTPQKQVREADSAQNTSPIYSVKFREMTSKFKVDQVDLNRLFETGSEDTGVKDSNYQSSETTTLAWSFYRDASCSDIFALLCYSMFTGNTLAFKTVLENSMPCMSKHLRDNWKVFLSYVPISFEFKDYQYAFEAVLFGVVDGKEHEVHGDVELLASFTDWCLWRIFLIINCTNSSYFLLIRFLKSLFKLLGPCESLPSIGSKLQVLNFLKFIIKQYFIYKSFNSGGNRKELMGRNGTDDSERREYMTFFEYLELDASRKLSLFCEFDLSGGEGECGCDEQYKDKHKIYKSCLQCKTRNLSNKLKSFFVLISPVKSGYSTPETPYCHKLAVGSSRFDTQDMENEYIGVNEEFRRFYESLVKSYRSGLNEYISGISESFRSELNVHSFEILYSLLTVLLETGFRGEVLRIFLNVVYSDGCTYNFLENYFIIKSIFNLIESNTDLKAHSHRVTTKNTLFKLLKHFETSNSNQITSSTHKRVCGRLTSTPRSGDDTLNTFETVDSGTVMDCIKCQLDFTEALLNFLALINVESDRIPVVTPAEVMLALVSEEHFLLALQKVLMFVVELGLEPEEFYNCLYELINLSSYISSVGMNEVHNMFFYTISLKDNLNYLNQELQLWYQNMSLTASNTESADVTFHRETVDCVLNAVYRMDLLCNINLFHLLIAYCKFVPRSNKFYLTHGNTSSLTIFSVVTLYLNYMNVYGNKEVDPGEEHAEKVAMLRTFGKIYKCLALFDKFKLMGRGEYRKLEYRFYGRDELIRRTLSSVISIINKNQLVAGGEGGEEGPELEDRKQGMLLLVFRCILDQLVVVKEFTPELFDNLKVAISELCPEEVSPTMFSLVHLLSNPQDSQIMDVREHVGKDGQGNRLNELYTNLLVVLHMGAYNLPFLSNVLQCCTSTQLSKSLTFMYQHLMNVGAQHRPAYILKLEDEYSTSSSKPDSEDDQTVNSDTEARDLFDYKHYPELDEYTFEIVDLRSSVMGAMDTSKTEKTSSKSSIGKLADRLGHTVASEFITAAIERAEGELKNIAKRTNKLDVIKEKLFYLKKEHGRERANYPQVPNYLNELLQYRNLKEISVSSMVPVDVDGACLMTMENCGFEYNRKFVKHVQEVFNKNDSRNVCQYLSTLVRHMEYCEWPQQVLAAVKSVNEFLKLFMDFPATVTVLVAPFVFRRDYRLGLFKSIPGFVASNLQLVQEIYRKLQVFHEAARLKHAETGPDSSIPNLEEYLFGPLPDEDPKATPAGAAGGGTDGPTAAGEFGYMEEYVEVLFGVYEDIFLDEFDINSFLQLEPLFLLNRDKYLYFLLKLYHNLTVPHHPQTPPTHQSSRTVSMLTNQLGTPRSPPPSSRRTNVEVNNSRLVVVRRCICNFLTVYPELRDSFSALHRPECGDLVELLEAVLLHVPELDLTAVDNFEAFKLSLMGSLNLSNFFFVSNAVEKLDRDFAGAVYRKLELRLRPHSDELVDCTRLLFEYDLSNNTL